MSHQHTFARVCPPSQDPRFTLFLLDLDNTVWYGNYQRHGYLFAKLQYYLLHHLSPDISVEIPEADLRKNWQLYTNLLHLTAPEQLEFFLIKAWKNDSTIWTTPQQKTQLYRQWSCWMDQEYWHLVDHPHLLWIADEQAEVGRDVSLVPGFTQFAEQLMVLKKQHQDVRVIAISLNLHAISEYILTKLGVRQVFDEIHGVTWNDGHISKPELIERCLESGKNDRRQAIMIGDSKGDIQAGQSAKVATLAIATGPTAQVELAQTNPSYCWLRWPTIQEEYRALLYGND